MSKGGCSGAVGSTTTRHAYLDDTTLGRVAERAARKIQGKPGGVVELEIPDTGQLLRRTRDGN